MKKELDITNRIKFDITKLDELDELKPYVEDICLVYRDGPEDKLRIFNKCGNEWTLYTLCKLTCNKKYNMLGSMGSSLKSVKYYMNLAHGNDFVIYKYESFEDFIRDIDYLL